MLLKDLCRRLPYGAKVDVDGKVRSLVGLLEELVSAGYDINDFDDYALDDVKPYLRPVSSMTVEEKDALLTKLTGKKHKHLFKVKRDGRVVETDDRMCKTWRSVDAMRFDYIDFCPKTIGIYTTFMYAHHFDIDNLIRKGLALKAPQGMYE